MTYLSQSIENLVEELSKLPSIGKKTALRLALHLLKRTEEENNNFAITVADLKPKTRLCTTCNAVSDFEICGICSDTKRNKNQICVVESIADLIALEKTGQYNGVYQVLGGILNPMEGIGTDDLMIEKLLERVQNEDCEEVILALNATMEGEITSFYIARKINALGIKITNIARGVPLGSELEFTDELTLARSIQSRTRYILEKQVN